MRTILGLLIIGLLAGDGLIAVIVAAKLFFHRYGSKTFTYLSLLFFAIALHLILLLAAFGELPQPVEGQPHPRPISFRVYVLAALSVLSIGVWPASLHFVMIGKKKE